MFLYLLKIYLLTKGIEVTNINGDLVSKELINEIEISKDKNIINSTDNQVDINQIQEKQYECEWWDINKKGRCSDIRSAIESVILLNLSRKRHVTEPN